MTCQKPRSHIAPSQTLPTHGRRGTQLAGQNNPRPSCTVVEASVNELEDDTQMQVDFDESQGVEGEGAEVNKPDEVKGKKQHVLKFGARGLVKAASKMLLGSYQSGINLDDRHDQYPENSAMYVCSHPLQCYYSLKWCYFIGIASTTSMPSVQQRTILKELMKGCKSG